MGDRSPREMESPDPALAPPSYASLITPLAPGFPAFNSTSRNNTPFEHPHSHLGLPSGYFLLRNKSTRQRTFDVRGRGQAEGNEICTHPVKQPHVGRSGGTAFSLLQNSYNNQVLYLDWNGHLSTASADGRAIDCVDGDLILSIPRPIFAIPSRESHPLPQFRLDPETSTLHVQFSYDPSFPGPDSTSDDWMHYEYLVESVPMRRKKEDPSVWATASSGLLSGIEKLGFFARSPSLQTLHQPPTPAADERVPPPPVKPLPPWEGRSPGSQTIFDLHAQQPPPPPPPHASTSSTPLPYVPYRSGSNSPLPALPSTSTLPPPPASPSARRLSNSFPSSSSLSSPPDDPSSSHSPSDRDSDSDGDNEAYRPLRVIRLSPSWREKFPRELLARPLPSSSSASLGVEGSAKSELRKWRRRQFDVVPVVVKPIETPSGGNPILPLLPRTGLLSGDFTSVGAMVGIGRANQDAERERRERERPRPLNLLSSPGARDREGIVSPPLPRVPVGDDEDDARSRFGSGSRTPATGDSWADATILPSAAIAGLAISPPSPNADRDLATFPSTPPRASRPPTPAKEVPSTPLPTLQVVSPEEHSLASLPPVPVDDPVESASAEAGAEAEAGGKGEEEEEGKVESQEEDAAAPVVGDDKEPALAWS